MSRFTSMLSLVLATACLPAAAQTAPPAKGTVVVRDAETGEVRAPTAAEMRTLQPAPSATAKSSAARAQSGIMTGPGGRRSVRLDERHMVYSVVTRDADGKHEECVKGGHAAEQVLNKPASATKPEEHRHEAH